MARFDNKQLVQAVLGMEERAARLRQALQSEREIDRACAQHDLDSLQPVLAAFNAELATYALDARPLRVDWNKFDLAEAYDLVEGVRRQAAQHPESGIDSSLRAALDAIEAADCEWDGMTKPARAA